MAIQKHLIIGSGPAALSAAERLRSLNRDDEIKMVSAEQSLPYCPAVLPYLLAGRTSEKNIWLASEEKLSSMKVTLSAGKKAVRVLPEKKQVIYQDGDADNYDSLLIAAGAEPVTSPVEGLGENDFLTFHNLADYRRLDGLLKVKNEVAILGAGMVAVELALALVEMGVRVRIVGRGRPLRAYFDEQAGGYISDIMSGRGVTVRTGKNIDRIEKHPDGIRIHCAGGEVLKAGLLVSCLGVRPGLSLVEGSGIRTNQGILVDDRMRTSVSGIYAAGDVAETPDFLHHRAGVSAILPSAIAQGKVAGSNMAGTDCRYEGWISMNLLNIFGSPAFSIGLAMPGAGEAEVLEEKDDKQRRFRRLVTRGRELIGAMFVNVDLDPGVIKYLIEKRIDVSAHKKALLEQPKEVGSWLMLKNERRAPA